MPLLAYFGLVGSILVGLLYVAEAQLGPAPQSVGLSTNFHGIPAPYKVASTPILTVRDAPAPPIVQEKVAQPAVTPPTPAPTKIVVRAKTKKVAKAPKAPRQNINVGQNMFGFGQNVFAQGAPVIGKNHRIW